MYLWFTPWSQDPTAQCSTVLLITVMPLLEQRFCQLLSFSHTHWFHLWLFLCAIHLSSSSYGREKRKRWQVMQNKPFTKLYQCFCSSQQCLWFVHFLQQYSSSWVSYCHNPTCSLMNCMSLNLESASPKSLGHFRAEIKKSWQRPKFSVFTIQAKKTCCQKRLHLLFCHKHSKTCLFVFYSEKAWSSQASSLEYSKAWEIAAALAYFNHSCNFFLYMISGQQFRQWFREVICGFSCHLR